MTELDEFGTKHCLSLLKFGGMFPSGCRCFRFVFHLTDFEFTGDHPEEKPPNLHGSKHAVAIPMLGPRGG